MIKRRKNLLKLTGVALLAALALGIGATGAVIHHEMALTNTIQTPTVDVAIDEEVGGNPVNGVKTKKVAFENMGTADVFLRIAYAEQWSYYNEKQRETIILPNCYEGDTGRPVAKIQWDVVESKNWQDGNDGWLYYKKVLKPGEANKTADIINAVIFPGAYEDERYNAADYQLHFQAEVVQASDEWQVSMDAVREVFDRGIGIGTVDWANNKDGAYINWTD